MNAHEHYTLTTVHSNVIRSSQDQSSTTNTISIPVIRVTVPTYLCLNCCFPGEQWLTNSTQSVFLQVNVDSG